MIVVMGVAPVAEAAAGVAFAAADEPFAVRSAPKSYREDKQNSWENILANLI